MRSFRFGFADRKAHSLHARAIHCQRQQLKVGLSEFGALVQQANGKGKMSIREKRTPERRHGDPDCQRRALAQRSNKQEKVTNSVRRSQPGFDGNDGFIQQIKIIVFPVKLECVCVKCPKECFRREAL